MAQQKNTRLEKQQLDAISAMVDKELADNESEAHRMLLNAGIEQYGLGVTGSGSTLSKVATQFAWIFGIVGVAWLAITITYPVGLRVPAVAAFSSSFGCWALGQAVDHYELSTGSVFGGDSA